MNPSQMDYYMMIRKIQYKDKFQRALFIRLSVSYIIVVLYCRDL